MNPVLDRSQNRIKAGGNYSYHEVQRFKLSYFVLTRCVYAFSTDLRTKSLCFYVRDGLFTARYELKVQAQSKVNLT